MSKNLIWGLSLLLGACAQPSDVGIDAQPNVASTTQAIVEGRVAGLGKQPWAVYVDGVTSLCTGTLIDREWVLTAAHCDHGWPMRMTFGSHDDDPRGRVVRSSRA